MSNFVKVNVSFIPKQYISWNIDFIICDYRKVSALVETQCILWKWNAVGWIFSIQKQNKYVTQALIPWACLMNNYRCCWDTCMSNILILWWILRQDITCMASGSPEISHKRPAFLIFKHGHLQKISLSYLFGRLHTLPISSPALSEYLMEHRKC